MKKIYIFTKYAAVLLMVLLGHQHQLQAQSAPQFTQFFFNKLQYNPAYAGAKEVLSVAAQYRYQWMGLSGAPQTANLSAHLPFFHNRCGLGISLINDKIALLNSNHLTLSYAYRIPFKKSRSTLSFGVQGTFQADRFDWGAAEVSDFQDDVIPFGLESSATGNVGLGLHYSSRSFYVGLSMPRFFQNGGLYNALLNLSDSSPMRTYYLMSGFSIPLTKRVVLKPAVLVTYNTNAPPTADLNLSVLIMDTFWVGATYRSGDSIDGVFQYRFNKRWRMGISYDYTISELSVHTTGTAEVILAYMFDKEKDKLKNLRFFD